MTYLQKKKLAFMSIVNRVKGFVRTVTGTPPLTLPDCVDENSIINYTIKGNSAQDGTPSPDNPIGIESVGEKTKNLFDKEYWNSLTSAKLENMRTLINVSDTAQVTIIPLGIGKGTYTFSVENALLTNGYYYGLYDVLDGNVVSRTMIYRNNEWLSPITINVTGELYIGSWYNSASLSAQPVRAIRDLSDSSAKTQIEEGTTATPYEPYGYKIPVKVSGKDLIPYPYYHKFANYKGVDITYNKDGSLTLNGTHTESIVSNFTLFQKDTLKLPKGTYTMSCDGLTDTKSVYMVVSINGTYRIIYANSKYTFTFDEDTYLGAGYIQFAAGAVFDNVTVKPLIERGSEATEYEPYIESITTNIYLNEPLRKINDYADYIDFENQKVVRNIKHIDFTGDENWRIATDGDVNKFPDRFSTVYYTVGTNTLITNGETKNCLCNRFHPVARNRMYSCGDTGMSANTSAIRVYYPPITDSVADFKAFLVANPTYADCILATPIEENIDLSKLPTFKGTTVYSIETNIQPSNMSATYYSTSKEE